MTLWFKLGARNLLKNRRRSAFTVCAVALGFAAINLMGGFMHYVLRGLEESYVHAFGNSHLAVFKEGPDDGAEAPLFDADELRRILDRTAAVPGVVLATPQLHFTGLLSNGERSTICFIQGVVPEDIEQIRSRAGGVTARLRFHTGEALRSGDPHLSAAYGLAEELGLVPGDSVIVLANTAAGFMNALDAELVQLQDAPLEVLDELLLTVPYDFARTLFDTDGADRVLVLLEDGRHLDRTAAELQAELSAAGLKVRVQDWMELRPSYHRIRGMFSVLFNFVFLVVALIVALAVVNTIGISVIERTREIGTLRAMGLRRSGVVMLFAVESGLLGGAGVAAGFVIFWFVRGAVAALDPLWIPPNIPKEVPWEIAWAPGFLIVSALAILFLALLAAILPARKAARLPVTDALSHV